MFAYLYTLLEVTLQPKKKKQDVSLLRKDFRSPKTKIDKDPNNKNSLYWNQEENIQEV